MLVSGARPQGDVTTFSDAYAHTILSRLVYKVVNDHDLQLVGAYDSGAKFAGETRPHTFLLPRIQDYDILTSSGSGFYVWGVAIHRVAKDGGSLTEAGGYVDTPVFSCCGIEGSNAIDDGHGFSGGGSDQHYFLEGTGVSADFQSDEKNSLGLFFISSGGGWFLLYGLYYETGDKSAGTAQVKLAQFHFESKGFLDPYSSTSQCSFQTFDDTTNAFLWHGHNGILAKSGSKLVSLLSPRTYGNQADFVATDVGPDGFDVETFAVSPDGAALYFPRVRDGKLPDIDNGDGTYTPNTQEIKEYDIMAATVVETDSDGTLGFISPYRLAQLGHAPDQLVEYLYGNNFTFIYDTITDLATSSSDLYLVAVPRVVSLHLVGLCPLNQFVSSSAREPFHVTVINNGNTVVEGFWLQIHNSSGFSDPARIHITTSSVNAVPGISDMKTVKNTGVHESAASAPTFLRGESDLDAPAKAGVCIPGKEQTYRFDLPIPADWDGRVDITVEISDIDTSNRSGYLEKGKLGASAKDTLKRYAQTPVKHSLQVGNKGSSDAGFAPNYYASGVGAVHTPGPSPQTSDGTGGAVLAAGALALAGGAALALAAETDSHHQTDDH
jgi:hypothetical protein